MTDHDTIQCSACAIEDIAAYIDGELNAEREIEIEAHFAICEPCSAELNLQKQFLCEVSRGLRSTHEIDLPADFAKTIAINAESSVRGLRGSRERFNAVFICAALALFALFALGADAQNLIGLAYGIFEQIAAVGSLFGQLVYSFFLGLTIVLRSAVLRVGIEPAIAIVLAVFCAAATLRFRHRVVRLLRV